MSFPAARRDDHRRFCELEGWRLVRSATGKRSTHHETYELELPTGDVLRTRISRPPDRTAYEAEPNGEAVARAARERSEQEREITGDAAGRWAMPRGLYGSGLWSHILRDQLQVSQQDFWQCVNDGVLPPRSQPAVPADSIPTEVLYLLKQRVGLSDDQLAGMTAEAAIERLQQYWTTGE